MSMEPDYASMSRGQLIAYCERLRQVLATANPLGFAHGEIDKAAIWEREAIQALNSHVDDNPDVMTYKETNK